MTELKWRIRVYENYHYMDEDEAYDLSEEFDTEEAAVAKAKAMVDADLKAIATPGSSAEGIYSGYTMFGDDPRVHGPKGSSSFSAWQYAETRSADFARPDEPVDEAHPPAPIFEK